MLDRLVRRLSRIWIRLLAFNILLVFLPALGLPYFRLYEQKLLDLQERSMVQQGRLLAAALGAGGSLDREQATAVLVNLRQEVEARLRVVDRSSRLLADTSRLGPRSDQAPPLPAEEDTRESWIYRLGSFLYGLYAGLLLPPEPPLPELEFYASAETLDGPEIQRALAGEYGSATRATRGGQRSLTLYSALPIRHGDEILGAVLVSKSTYRILQDLYDFRLRAFRVVLASFLASIVLSLLVATTIARPLSRLRDQAQALLDRRGRLRGSFRGLSRRDEVGDLSRALAELTRRLEGHIRFIESFASDVSHEFKNPLASIRNATELLAEVEDPAERQRFLDMVLRDVARLEHLLSDVREITRIDAALEDEAEDEPVELGRLLRALVERYELRPTPGPSFSLRLTDEAVRVRGSAERLTRIFENILANALSFSPEGGEVRIELERRGEEAIARIRDQGPGIPPEHREKIFDRFFTYRPAAGGSAGTSEAHSGLGLSIVRALVHGHGGEIGIVDGDGVGDGEGAIFEVRLPLEDAAR